MGRCAKKEVNRHNPTTEYVLGLGGEGNLKKVAIGLNTIGLNTLREWSVERVVSDIGETRAIEGGDLIEGMDQIAKSH